MINFSVSGSTKKTQSFLTRMKTLNVRSALESAGQRGVAALQLATPADSGLTSASWSYEITVKGDTVRISWTNSNEVNGVNVAVILQYGHGTGSGGYVAGRDYINPAIQPIFDQIADDVWKQVTNS